MPQLVAIHKRNDDKPFVMVGMHAQNATNEEVQAVVKKLKVKFPIVKNGGGIGGSGIPHVVVFDSKGDQVFEGHTSDGGFEKAIKKALKEVEGAGGSAGGLGPKKTEPAKPAKDEPKVLFTQRNWTSKDGKTMSAALLSVSGTTGTFMMGTKKFTMKLDKLSDEDQKSIEEAVKEASAPKDTPKEDSKDTKDGKKAA